MSNDLMNVSGYLSDDTIEEMLNIIDTYIVNLAKKYVARSLIPLEVLDLEIDEIAQNTRIKLWLVLQKEHIGHPKAYVRRIVYNESVNIVRRYKDTLPLPLDEKGELYYGTIMLMPGQETQDPADEIEREEELADYMKKIVSDVIKLPPCQQRAMICALKDQVVDILALVNEFSRYDLNIEAIEWSEEKKIAQSLRASLSVARRKMRCIDK